MPRLDPDTLERLAHDVASPEYDRTTLEPGIVHLGIGAFARAHLAPATDAAIAATGDRRWGIVGVSLRSPDTRDALAPQRGLYTLALRDADERSAPRQRLQVIGSLIELLVAPENPDAVLARIAAPATRIVTLSVTEKGYHRDPASGALNLADPDIAHDLTHWHVPRTTLGFLVHGLHRRRMHGAEPVTLLSCDNLPANGDTLRALVLAFAREVDAQTHDWIADRCTFPNTMVDRIVPRSTEADRAAVSAALGADDAWPVVAEPYFDWAIEDRFANGRPDWTRGGARFVPEAAPFEMLKLRMVNGSHSAIAYLGAMAGWKTVDAAIAHAALRGYADALLRDEVAPTLPPLPGLDLDTFRTRLIGRFANPALHHRTAQIAMDGSQKLPQRLLGTLRDRRSAGASFKRLALAVAAWIHYLRGRDEAGEAYAIDDPLADALRSALASADAAASGDGETAQRGRIAAFMAATPLFGPLAQDDAAIAAIAHWRDVLDKRGVRAALAEIGGQSEPRAAAH